METIKRISCINNIVFIIFYVYLSIGGKMAEEGIATIQKISPKEAAKNLETVFAVTKGKIDDIVISILVGPSVYLTITVPKKAVEEKLSSMAALPEGEKAGEIMKWLKENVDNALNEYKKQSKEKSFKKSFTFPIVKKGTTLTPIKVPAPSVEQKGPLLTSTEPEEKRIKSGPFLTEEEKKKKETVKTINIILFSETAEKEAEKDNPQIISVSAFLDFSKIAGCNINIKLNVTEKSDLKVDDVAFKKKIQEFAKMAVENAKKQGLMSSYKVGNQTIYLENEFRVAIGRPLGDKRLKLFESKATQTIKW